ncbi:MAG: MOSC domain-containing protein [Bacteroidota bacterium]
MEMKKLMATMPQLGKIEWIGLRPERRKPLESVDAVDVAVGVGLVGDHYKGKSGKRQVTLIQAEHLQAVASILGQGEIDPRLTRRNIVVSGVNLLAFNNHRLQIGEEVILEMTGLCHPCSRMEENLGPGGYNAMRGHGGINTRVIQAGRIKLGDAVRFLAVPAEEAAK